LAKRAGISFFRAFPNREEQFLFGNWKEAVPIFVPAAYRQKA
jgi:hypothetical protein